MDDSSTSSPRKENKKHVAVMVLGDIGRSPRMQYHTLSLLEHGHSVTLIGYVGEKLIPFLAENGSIDYKLSMTTPTYHAENLRVIRMKPYLPSKRFKNGSILSRLFYYPVRLTSLIYCLFYALWIKLHDCSTMPTELDVILVQNPPSVPTLLLVYLYCVWMGLWRKKRPRFVIDWHNLGYTMFEEPTQQTSLIRTSALNLIRTTAKTYERILAPLADAHLTVTRAMEVWLGEHFGVHGKHVRVLYDAPHMLFRPTTVEEQHELFQRLDLDSMHGLQLHEWLNSTNNNNADDTYDEQTLRNEETLFTQCILDEVKSSNTSGNGQPLKRKIRPREKRPALLVSSTSWTPDEDFSVLLEALKKLHALILEGDKDSKLSITTTFPDILVVVTGKGPQKEYFLPLLHEFNEHHQHIKILTLWLEASDYPKLLGCATLGVSLHTSTSGLDLPMKVLDMFGCHVPVCAIGFDCLDELVKDGVNGRVFCDGEELSRQLFDLLKGYPLDTKELDRYRQNIRGMTRWRENWDECARHLIVGDDVG